VFHLEIAPADLDELAALALPLRGTTVAVDLASTEDETSGRHD
jgi:hypothetical protein